MKYVSVDIETTGLDRITNDIIEFAAVIDDLNDPKPIDELPVFHAYIEKENRIYVGDPFALSMHQKIFEILACPGSHEDKQFCTVNSLMYAFSNFLHQHKYPFNEEKNKFTIIPAGKNFGSFDRPFLETKVPKEHWHDIYFHHRILDPAMLYFNPAIDDILPDTKTCMERAEIEGEVEHTAEADAKVVIKLLRRKYCGPWNTK
jgi:oligoribonuclease (3'-5' exoribonuclease)